jgi:N-acetylglutamate synthase-like GNAT family acetyltransferase
VFVDPDHQAKGIDTRLMNVIESVASAGSILKLSVPSSLTAEGFYKKLGYNPVHEELHGNKRTMVLEEHPHPQVRRNRAEALRMHSMITTGP